ncbi:PLP-dependent transferase [Vibrio lentus]|nr:PLP-dependent transferase [Vibrio lentus]
MKLTKYDYTRSGNPNRGLLETALFELESGKARLSPTCVVLRHLTYGFLLFLGGDDLIIAPHDCYGAPSV